LTDFDAEPIGVSPYMRGVNSSIDGLLDDSNSYGLSNQLVEDVIEQLRTQAFPEIVKGDMRRSVEEVKAAYKLKPDIELQLFSQIPFGICLSQVYKEQCLIHGHWTVTRCSFI
jgi:hypothetical protein